LIDICSTEHNKKDKIKFGNYYVVHLREIFSIPGVASPFAIFSELSVNIQIHNVDIHKEKQSRLCKEIGTDKRVCTQPNWPNSIEFLNSVFV
jgi:hypothetical protein